MATRGRTLRSDLRTLKGVIGARFEPVLVADAARRDPGVGGAQGLSPSLGKQHLNSLFIFSLVLLLVGSTLVGTAQTPARAAGSAVIGMPFAGRWANNLETAPYEHPIYTGGGRWAMDIYGAEKAEVRARISGASKLTIRYRTVGPCGTSVGVNVFVDGVSAGYVNYSHLLSAPGFRSNQEIQPGDFLGKIADVGVDDVSWSSECWQVSVATGTHTHFEAANGNSCYVNYAKGTSLADGAAIGRLGPGEPSGIRKECSGVPPVDPPATHSPVGHLDRVERTTNGVRLAGWARDADDFGAALQIQALIDGNPVGGTATAVIFRPDGGIGNHGFDFSVPMDDNGHQVCARAIGVGGGGDARLPDCFQVEQLFHNPEGTLDSVARIDGGHVRLVGRASDADVDGPIQVQAVIDGTVAGQATANVRGDGFDFVAPTDWRSRRVCANALNAGGGGVDVELPPGCVQVPFALCPDMAPTIISTKPNHDLLGTPGDDVIWASGGGLRLASSGGNDTICGGGATGGPGGNRIIGGPGNNLIFTGPGNNDVVAGPGHTTVVSGGGHNRITVCPRTIVLNRGPQDEVLPGRMCGPATPLLETPPEVGPVLAGGGAAVPPIAPSSTSDSPTITALPITSAPSTTGTPATSAPLTTTVAPATGVAPTTVPAPASSSAISAAGGPVPCAGATSTASTLYAVSGTGEDGVAVRQGPSSDFPVSYTLAEGDALAIFCYVESVAVNGNMRWNRLSDGMWIADTYTTTPKD